MGEARWTSNKGNPLPSLSPPLVASSGERPKGGSDEGKPRTCTWTERTLVPRQLLPTRDSGSTAAWRRLRQLDRDSGM